MAWADGARDDIAFLLLDYFDIHFFEYYYVSEVSRNANAYTIQEENSTPYCTSRSHNRCNPITGNRFTRFGPISSHIEMVFYTVCLY